MENWKLFVREHVKRDHRAKANFARTIVNLLACHDQADNVTNQRVIKFQPFKQSFPGILTSDAFINFPFHPPNVPDFLPFNRSTITDAFPVFTR